MARPNSRKQERREAQAKHADKQRKRDFDPRPDKRKKNPFRRTFGKARPLGPGEDFDPSPPPPPGSDD